MTTFKQWRDGQSLYIAFKEMFDERESLIAQRRTYGVWRDSQVRLFDDDLARKAFERTHLHEWEDEHPWNERLEELAETLAPLDDILAEKYKLWIVERFYGGVNENI